MKKGQKKGERLGVLLTCPCGKQFYREVAKAKRSRTCSKHCQYKYARRPSGLTYQIKVVNRSWFKHGDPAINPFPKGQIPPNFKGDAVGYCGVHDWIRYHYGKPTKCERCGKTDGRLHWANRSWKYKRDISDWLQLCPKCHQKYDRAGGWGLATQKFPEMRR